jgi:Ca2+-binding RTX toxin-like protein
MAKPKPTLGPDMLTQTNAPDRINGSAGGDRISTLRGNDTISGGEGADTVLGGRGNDVIYGFGSADKQAGSGKIVAERVGNGFDAPVFLTHAPGDNDNVYVVEKTGQIRILDPDTGAKSAFLTIPNGQMSEGGEQGLLGLAFHPDYATNGKFYIYMVNEDGDLEIRVGQRSAGDPLKAEAATEVILTIPHPGESNHNGGWLGFGPDGMLYIAVGDGGGSGDPSGNAQNIDSLLGKMLRIDVTSPPDAGLAYAIPEDNPYAGVDGRDEIWATGLRNPWRPSFDRETGDLYIADVGQNNWEEINFQPFDSAGGENYGWDWREGQHPHEGTAPDGLTDPLVEYPHVDGPNGGFSITGGYVYRGQGPGMEGVYFYADFVTNQLWSFRVVDGKAQDAANRTAQLLERGGSVDQIASFGEDAQGNLYILGLDGEIFRLTPRVAAGDGADLLTGNEGHDKIWGGIGHDTLMGGTGKDTLVGGDDNDFLFGGSGADIMTGSAGADRFVFAELGDSNTHSTDRIRDFGEGADRIGLDRLDANTELARDQDFKFIGQANFSKAGQVRAVQTGDNVRLLLNTDSDKTAEMVILLLDTKLSSIGAGDFIL